MDRPKAFAALRGRPLLAESLERLESSDWIEAIVIVAPEEWEEPAILLAEQLGCGKVSAGVTGGPSRAESVRIGVAEVPEDTAAIVVHDAARPLISDDVIERVLAPLGEGGFDGAVPVLPVADTIKRVADGVVVETLQRGELVAVQTPQAFAAGALRAAVAGEIAGASDCASLVEGRGGLIKVVDGDRRLLKVTSAEDLALVEAWLG